MAVDYRGEKFAGYNKPKRTPNASKSHAMLAKEGSKIKLIRFSLDKNVADNYAKALGRYQK